MTINSLVRKTTSLFLLVILFPSLCLAESQQPRKKIGLVLSGGGARGAAHVGVLKVLDELNVPIDYIAGTSMGAIVGGLYASGMSATELEEVIENADWVRLLSDKPPRSQRTFRRKSDDQGFLVNFDMGLRKRKLVFPRGLVQGQVLTLELRKLLNSVATTDEFDQLPIPFRAIAADIVTGEQVVMDSGDLVASIRASMSVPGLFKPVRIDRHLLVDGGIVNNLPIDIVKAMGADILIVVDVGTPPSGVEELNSPLKVTSQMLTILIASQSEQKKKLMSAEDVLITPELGSLSSSAFDQSPLAADLGEQTARESIAKLARLSLSEQDYADHRAVVQSRRHEPPMIHEVVIENQSRLSSKVLSSQLSDHVGKALDTSLLEEDISNIYGFDTYETVDYSVVPVGAKNELHIRSKDKDWGPNFIRFGINLEDDFQGDSRYNFAARLTQTEINRLGGEIRSGLVVGDSPELSLELYQPLDYAARWFVNPRLLYESNSSGLFNSGNQLALFRSQDTSASIALGRNFGNWGELRLTLARNFSNSDVEIGDPELAGGSNDVSNFVASFQYDTIDRVAIPRYGTRMGLEWLGLREGFGAEQSLDLLNLFVIKPQTWGKNTLLHWWNIGSVINEGDSPLPAFRLGGFFNLSGLAPNELQGQHTAMGRMLYYRSLGNPDLSLLKTPIYLGASLEAGNVWQEKEDASIDDLRYSVSLFVVFDTIIGPLYIAYGANDDNRDSGYLFLGQTF